MKYMYKNRIAGLENKMQNTVLHILELFWVLVQLNSAFTHFGSDICNGTISLGTQLFAGSVDFAFSEVLKSGTKQTWSCTIAFEAMARSHIALNFKPLVNGRSILLHQNGCHTFLEIRSKNLDIRRCNFFPDVEVTSFLFLNISLKVKQLHFLAGERFELLFFTFHTDNCSANETACIGSKRCIHKNLVCSKEYDFCSNNFQSCEKKHRRKSDYVSFTDIYICVACLMFLLAVSCCVFFCGGHHWSNYSCHCSMTLHGANTRHSAHAAIGGNIADQTGANENILNRSMTNPDSEMVQVNGARSVIDNLTESETDNVTFDRVNFELPPSYSFVQRTDMANGVGSEDNVQAEERNAFGLLPSYSTVLAHKEEYHVHG